MNHLTNILDKKLNNGIEWVFFDFFDTIVHRKIHTESIKKNWARQIKKKFGLNLSISQIYGIRQQSEDIVSHDKGILNREYCYRELCDEMYMRLLQTEDCIGLERQCTNAQFYAHCLAVEEILETENLYLDEKIEECINLVYKRNKKIAVVSDFYLPETSIVNILNKLNMNHFFNAVFISCDYKQNKACGNLYGEVFRQLGISPEKCIMIGDNYISDYRNAKHAGAQAIFVKYKEYPEQMDWKNICSKLNGIYKSGSHYSNYSFSLYLFIERLYNNVKNKNIRKLLFLTREGQFLKKLFDDYLKIREPRTDITTHYFYTSRIASFTPGLKELSEEKFEHFFQRYSNLSIHTFLSSIGFSESQISELKKNLKIEIDEIIENFADSQEWKNLRSSQEFVNSYDSIRLVQKKYLLEYLHQLGIKEDELFLVDVGWRGTIQDNLFQALGEDIKITGFYIGLSKVSKVSSCNRKIGLLFSEYPVQSRNFEVWNFDKFMYERILLADHASTICYRKNQAFIEPVLKEYAQEHEAYQYVLPILDEIFIKFRSIDKLLVENLYEAEHFYNLFVMLHLKMITVLDKRCVNIQKKLYEFNYETFGEFSKTKIGNAGVIKENIRTRNLPFRKILKNGFNLKYVNRISIITYMINKKAGMPLIVIMRLLYIGECRRIRKGEHFES